MSGQRIWITMTSPCVIWEAGKMRGKIILLFTKNKEKTHVAKLEQ